MNITIRRATTADAAQAVEILRRSITALCDLDHQNDPAALAGWLQNKTVSNLLNWIARPDAAILVAIRASKLVGVGMIDQGGAILLNYVDPDARFQGVSKRLLAAMETEALRHGAVTCQVESTLTARPFYLRRGYTPDHQQEQRLSKPL